MLSCPVLSCPVLSCLCAVLPSLGCYFHQSRGCRDLNTQCAQVLAALGGPAVACERDLSPLLQGTVRLSKHCRHHYWHSSTSHTTTSISHTASGYHGSHSTSTGSYSNHRHSTALAAMTCRTDLRMAGWMAFSLSLSLSLCVCACRVVSFARCHAMRAPLGPGPAGVDDNYCTILHYHHGPPPRRRRALALCGLCVQIKSKS